MWSNDKKTKIQRKAKEKKKRCLVVKSFDNGEVERDWRAVGQDIGTHFHNFNLNNRNEFVVNDKGQILTFIIKYDDNNNEKCMNEMKKANDIDDEDATELL
jgi:hypothetical protein